MRSALRLLELLSERLPPLEGQHHALILGEGRLSVALAPVQGSQQFRLFTLDAEELDMAPEQVADAIVALADVEVGLGDLADQPDPKIVAV